ncbi:MAG TPA: UDP-3-O-(3-hydroxymyristoyl)glucosamine N-acyltransferase [Bacteroidia bacterium]|jgi:UDP-3-O-[3-hydroxymyristoyl] glucosamine N-acyltransferase|nr:UDP-3-O-(3-hydroxymyristoyl)glucosamine N-acyltransferase [Bacteroidia bacterium]
MKFSAKEIAALIGGKVEGDPDSTVSKLAKIEEGIPGSLTFLSNPQYASYIYTTGATIAIVNNDFVAEQKIPSTLTLVRCADSRQAFAKLLDAYNQFRLNKTGVDPKAHVSPSAVVGKNVYIGAFAFIGDHVVIGDNTKIHPHVHVGDAAKVGSNSIIYSGVKIYHDCVIGNHCILQAGTIVGGDGFGFQPNSTNNYQKVPHIGNVIIEDHVEIGANTTIDRATLGSTIIRKGVKLDNLIQVAHNVEIGENTVIAAQTGIAGSTKIGKDCMIGGQVGIIGHLQIGDRVKIAAQSGIGNNLKDEEIVQGSPAFAIGDYKRSYVVFRNLPDLYDKVKTLHSSSKTEK